MKDATVRDWLTRDEVANLFRVNPNTVTRWDQAGRFPEGTVIRTLGGHRRYLAGHVHAVLRGSPQITTENGE
jgi:hypothetical protein